ncbi:hypothetical protein [Arthrobacter sp. AZCC_0090]|uniref:hypothetical protein n=1 Tax=Arthrobacter sp. AZCC_0090 TaxID=2735881 RepID=UPI00161C6312|nr:hypothetical protein [Arthrobacter sp. AZCC_0090]MBB6406409.1 hypothetical protein [Arthrobacter sp. AZCC_0090]
MQELADWVEYLTGAAKSRLPDLRRSHGREQPWVVAFWVLGNETWGCGGSIDFVWRLPGLSRLLSAPGPGHIRLRRNPVLPAVRRLTAPAVPTTKSNAPYFNGLLAQLQEDTCFSEFVDERLDRLGSIPLPLFRPVATFTVDKTIGIPNVRASFTVVAMFRMSCALSIELIDCTCVGC